MFAGHYGASFALKKVDNRISLGYLFLAAQFIDVLWAIFSFFGIEKFRVILQLPSSPLDLYFMPFTHSLPGALFWSVAVYALFRLIPAPKGTRRSSVALIMAACVFSHWLLDLLVHRPDLALIGDTDKVGLGLYNYPLIAYSLEAFVLLGGLWLYMRSTSGNTFLGKWGMFIFAGMLLLINALTYWGRYPMTVQQLAVFNECFYLIMAAIVVWLDRKRAAKMQYISTNGIQDNTIHSHSGMLKEI